MNSLNKKWKEFLYAGCGFGPNLLMVLLGAYFSDAMNPAGLSADKANWSVAGYSLIMPAIFGVMWAIGKLFDGLIDIPLASLTDNLRTRWGRRRPALLIAFVPMVLSYVLAWTPISWQENSLGNTVWMTVMLMIFFASYTMSLITFYGSLSTVCSDEAQRQRVSSYKSFFDTIGYCIVYALIPVFIGGGINIRALVMAATPLMLTMLVPLFLIKEGEKYGEGKDYLPEARVKLMPALKHTLSNRLFLYWLIPNGIAFFGLHMFLASQNTLISGVMNLGAGYAAILNTAAFAPVPIMLILFYRLIRKKGLRTAFRVCLLTFAVAILNFNIGSEYLFPNSIIPRIIIGCLGGTIGSFAIGAFFATPYMVPSQIAAMELKLTGRDHTAMYFAVQGLTTAGVTAIATGLVYEYIKNVQTGRITHQLVLDAVAEPTWKVGVSLVPVIVTVMCVIGFFLCRKMPQSYSEDVVRAELERKIK